MSAGGGAAPGGAPGPPRGCNPLVFGLVAATLEMAALLWHFYR